MASDNDSCIKHDSGHIESITCVGSRVAKEFPRAFWGTIKMRTVWIVARSLALVLLCFVLSACATKYQEMGFTGGVAAEQVTSDTWRIKARGNSYTGASTIQDYVLLKAAETTIAAGGTHFQLISSSDASRTGVIVTPGQSTTTFSGNQAVTVTTPGDASQYIKPGQDTYIRVLRAPQQGALSANEIIQFTGARVKRS